MNKSDSIKELAIALNKAQAEFSPAPENSQSNRNKYADLGSIIETVKPILAKHGLSMSQLVEGNGNEVGITNLLMHVSGEWLESYISMSIGDAKGNSPAQAAGSIISYLRRYSLAAVLGVYSGDDTDGNAPARPKATSQQAPPRPAQVLPEAKQKNTPPLMSLEMAESETAADGTQYGIVESKELQNKTIGIRKMLAKNDLPSDKRDEYKRKLDAITVILAYRAEQEDDAARAAMNE